MKKFFAAILLMSFSIGSIADASCDEHYQTALRALPKKHDRQFINGVAGTAVTFSALGGWYGLYGGPQGALIGAGVGAIAGATFGIGSGLLATIRAGDLMGEAGIVLGMIKASRKNILSLEGPVTPEGYSPLQYIEIKIEEALNLPPGHAKLEVDLSMQNIARLINQGNKYNAFCSQQMVQTGLDEVLDSVTLLASTVDVMDYVVANLVHELKNQPK